MNSAYIVGDANGQTVFEVKRSAIKFFPKNVDFSIKLAAGSIEIGKITWIRTGLMSGRRLYKIIFPKDLAPEIKVALMAAWYKIVSIFFVLDLRRNQWFTGNII